MEHFAYSADVPSLTTYLWFLLTATIIIVIPGPSVLFILGRSITLGRRAGLVSVLGNTLGEYLVVQIVAFGVGALITASHVAFLVLKVSGGAYLVYLGVQTLRRRRHVGAVFAQSPQRVLVQSFLVGFSNPKTLIFLASVLPQFVNAGDGPAWLQLELFGTTFTAIALLSDSTWALVAGAARDWFATSPRRIERLSATGGAMMIGLGGVLLSTDA